MRIQLASTELSRLLPSSPAIAAHCHRVAALSGEVAARLALSWRAVARLEQAALLHHTAYEQFRELDRQEPGAAGNAPTGRARETSALPEELAAVLHVFHGGQGDRHAVQLAGILTMADAIDQQLEGLAWDPHTMDEVWEELNELSGLAGEAVWKAVCGALRYPCRLPAARSWDLPVHAPVVKEVVTGLRAHPDCDAGYLAQLAARDPVLAGNVLSTANSAWFGRRTPVRSVAQAIAYIGPEAGRRILLALALKPLYGSGRLATLWRHSVQMAGLCESLVAATGVLPGEEGMMLGLVHDIGRVALLRHGADHGACARLVGRGCPPLYAELLLLGEGHGEIGAGILSSWEFAPDLIEAVRAHHHPADTESVAAAALYLAEFWSATDEDLPSARHLDAAQRRLGCSIEMLAQASRGKNKLSDLLRVA